MRRITIGKEKLIIGSLSKAQIEYLLDFNLNKSDELFDISNKLKNNHFNKNYRRGVIELSNYCECNCEYCLIRRQNKQLDRFILTEDELRGAILEGQMLGLKTIMLQSGQSRFVKKYLMIFFKNNKFKDVDFILNIGEIDYDEMIIFKKNGINGFILKFETLNKELFYDLKHYNLSKRISCLNNLIENRFQVGSGFILGLPAQSKSDIINSLYYLQYLNLPMNSISPYINYSLDTYSENNEAIFLETLKAIAILRLVNPTSIIPSVSALNILNNNGQKKGLKVGANLVTVNLSPSKFNKKFPIYSKNRVVINSDYYYNNFDIKNFNNESSLGPNLISEKIEENWFKHRYNEEINVNDSVYGKTSVFFNKEIKSLLKEDDIIIDIGGGDGRHSIPIIKLVKEIISIDISVDASNRLSKRISFFNINNITNLNIDFFKLKSTKPATVIFVSNILYYFNYKKIISFLNIFDKILSTNGFIYISFESSILTYHAEGEIFKFNNIYNYTFDDIYSIFSNKEEYDIIKSNSTLLTREISIDDAGKKYKRFFNLNEFLIKKIL